MQELTHKANDAGSRSCLDDAGLILVDFKLEFGLYKGAVLQTISLAGRQPRLYKETLTKTVSAGLGGVVSAYEAVAHRLGVLSSTKLCIC